MYTGRKIKTKNKMKLLQELSTILAEARAYFAMDDIPVGGTAIYRVLGTDTFKMSKVKSKQGPFTIHLTNGDVIDNAAVVSTDASDWSTYKVKMGVKENSLNDVTIADMEDGLNVGDPVIISGDVSYKGETGVIDSFGHEKRFMVVKLKYDGLHSFHSSDVSYHDEDDSDEDDEDDSDLDTFWVIIYDGDNNTTGVGKISKGDGGKWRETSALGIMPHNWGSTYMGYLEPSQIISRIEKDYGDETEVVGPFYSVASAKAKATHDYGPLKESVGHINDDDYYVIDSKTMKPVGSTFGSGSRGQILAKQDATSRGNNFAVMRGMQYRHTQNNRI